MDKLQEMLNSTANAFDPGLANVVETLHRVATDEPKKDEKPKP